MLRPPTSPGRAILLFAAVALAGCRSAWESADEIAVAHQMTAEFAKTMTAHRVPVRDYRFAVAEDPSIRIDRGFLSIRWPGTDGCELRYLDEQLKRITYAVWQLDEGPPPGQVCRKCCACRSARCPTCGAGNRDCAICASRPVALICARSVPLSYRDGRLSLPLARVLHFRNADEQEAP